MFPLTEYRGEVFQLGIALSPGKSNRKSELLPTEKSYPNDWGQISADQTRFCSWSRGRPSHLHHSILKKPVIIWPLMISNRLFCFFFKTEAYPKSLLFSWKSNKTKSCCLPSTAENSIMLSRFLILRHHKLVGMWCIWWSLYRTLSFAFHWGSNPSKSMFPEMITNPGRTFANVAFDEKL